MTLAIRIGLLGDGAIASQHASAFAALGCEVGVVMAPEVASAKAFALSHGIPRWTCDAEEAFAAVEAVVVASPNAEHVRQTLAALAAGKHVLCEIPLALSLTEAERVCAAAETAGRVCMACHTQRFIPPVARLAKLVRCSAIAPRHVAVARAMDRRTNVGMTGRERTWVDDILWHHGAHALDTAAALLGEAIIDIVGHAGLRHPDTRKPLDVSLSLATASGRIGSIFLSYAARIPLNEILLVAEEDTFRFSDGELRDLAGTTLVEGSEAAMQSLAMQTQTRRFIEAVVEGVPCETAATAVLPIYELLQTAASRMGL